MPQSTIEKQPIWVRKIEGNQAFVRLRKNFAVQEMDYDGEKQNIINYDEVEVVIPNRPNLIQHIKDNFELVWYSNPEELAKRVLGQ